MNVLVINAGSSSLKFQLLDVDTREVYAKGNCERIGIDGSFVGYESCAAEGKQRLEVALPTHKDAMKYVIEIIEATGKDFIGIGHRVVQGGWYFPESKVVTDESLGWVREVAPLAPLHNYAEADVIEICRDMFPDKGNVVVADTSFHYNIPEYAHRYALPPLDGLIMGTRCGTVDPATVFYLSREGGYSIDEIDTMMNKQSGLLAISAISSDSRDIEEAAEAGDDKAQMAIDMFAYRCAQLICEMAQANEGIDTMAFSAGIGENSSAMRAAVAEKLAWLGVKIDPEKNKIRSGEIRDISAADSKIRVLVVPTNEEYMIALDVAELLG